MTGEVQLDIPKAFQFLLEPHRYKSAYGGRGAGRSWSFARVLAVLASYQKKRILCTREYQNSIKDSVHKTLSDQIELLNLSPYYNITKTEITSNIGSEFIFKGLQHPLEIKSIEGIDIVWLEEAQSVSEESWRFLIPTIRKDESEIWLSWNTGAKTDPTYQRFVINKPDDCVSKLLTYRDNPFFPNTLRKEMVHCKRVDEDAYNHIWEGLPQHLSDALVFKNKFVVEEFEAPQKVKFRMGADWGFSNDATTLIRNYIVGNDLFIDYEAYGVGVELEELPQLFDSIPGSRFTKIIADNSRPETISFMRKKGFPIVGCVKTATTKAGFVRDGLEFMRKFEKIHIHKRCIHTKDEFEHYSFKIDKKTEEVLPVLAEGFDHCFIGDTKIATNKGEVSLKDIKEGDFVYTRKGYKKVLTVWKNGHKEVHDYRFANGRTLTGTVSHKIILENGKKELKDVSEKDELFFLKGSNSEWKFVKTKNTRKSYLMESLFDGIKTLKAENVFHIHTTMNKASQKIRDFIEKFGNFIMGQFLKDFVFTIKMGIPLTMIFPIWNVCPTVLIKNYTLQSTTENTKEKLDNIFSTLEVLLLNGIKVKREENVILLLQKKVGEMLNKKNLFVFNAAKNLKDLSGVNTVQTNVKQNIGDCQELTMLKRFVSSASNLLQQIKILRCVPVVSNADQYMPIRIEEVYDLEIEDQHEYFANGVLVSNCIDAIRYSLEDLIRGTGIDWVAVVGG